MATSKRIGLEDGKGASASDQKNKKCPLTKAQFKEKAKPIAITIEGKTVYAEPKEFASGSFGFHVNEKVTVLIDGIPVKLQGNLILTAVGSKDA